MSNCPLCKKPLKPGNTKIVRKEGKRPYRVHRTCPGKKPKAAAQQTAVDVIHSLPSLQEVMKLQRERFGVFKAEIVTKPSQPSVGDITES